MNIECPKCHKQVELTKQSVLCGSCNENLSQHTYSKTKKKIGVTVSAIILGLGSYQASEYIHPPIDRYPMADEYQLLDACINADTRVLTHQEYLSKKRVCICALDKTILQFNYSSLLSNKKDLYPIFSRNIKKCDDAMY